VIENQGNSPSTSRIQWQDRGEELSFQPSQIQVTLPEGQKQGIVFRARPKKRRLLGGVQSYPFSVSATHDQGEALSSSGELLAPALIVGWLPPLVIALAAILCVGGFLAWNWFTDPGRAKGTPVATTVPGGELPTANMPLTPEPALTATEVPAPTEVEQAPIPTPVADDPIPQPVTDELIPRPVTYAGTLVTGSVDGGGIDASVFIVLTGPRGSTNETELDIAIHDDRERCSRDSYPGASDDLGNLTQVRIRHDNTDNRPGWFLEEVIVRNSVSGLVWEFPCSRWLATSEDDGHIIRTIYPGGPCV